MHTTGYRHQALVTALLLCLLALTTAVYWPGLDGAFLLDDDINLEGLTSINRAPDAGALFFYIVDGLASNLGRPVSLASFAAQFYAWPHNPEVFKYTNLMIHLLNGLLVFVLARMLLNRLAFSSRQSHWCALAACAVWLLHPIQISTVLYVVQRMAQLAALFSLLAMILYLKGREYYHRHSPDPGARKRGLLLSTAGYGLFGLLGVLSKENAILLPLLILVIEYSIYRDTLKDRTWKLWAAVFLYLPLAALLVFLLLSFNGYLDAYLFRPFSMLERVLTEARVLMDYLKNIFFIQPSAYGLFHDDYRVSRGLLSPPGTLLALLLIAGLLLTALRIRTRRLMILRFGILWFFAAHVLEASFVPLELYFEHRNYLALLGPALILVWAAGRLPALFDKSLIRYGVITGLAFWTLILVHTAYQETRLWGNPVLQAKTWEKEKPRSVRAQMEGIRVLARTGQLSIAPRRIRELAAKHPDNAVLQLMLFHVQCLLPEPGFEYKKYLARIDSAQPSLVLTGAMNRIILLKERKLCPGLDKQTMIALFDTLLSNPDYAFMKGDFYFLYARYYITLKQVDKILVYLEQSYIHKPRVITRLFQIQTLAYARRYKEALGLLKKTKPLLEKSVRERLLYGRSVASWEKMLLAKTSTK